jgi:hypothetical protein
VSDKPLGMMLTTAVAASVMIVCCGGGLAFVGRLIAHLSGSGVVLSVLTAAIAGFLAYFRRHRTRLSAVEGCGEDNRKNMK